MLILSLKELKVIAKTRAIKDYKSMSEDELLSALNLSETNFSKVRTEKTRKEFNESRYKFSRTEINEIRRNLYEVENEEVLSAARIKKLEEILLN